MLSEFLRSWYVDSCPGNSFHQDKCGEIKVSTGISGVSTLSAPPPPPPPDVFDLDTAPRALAPPGTRIVPGPGPGSLAFNVLTSVWFDGHSAFYNLPTGSNSSSFAMSFWYNPWHDHAGVGEDDGPGDNPVLYGSPTQFTDYTDGGGNPQSAKTFFSVEPAINGRAFEAYAVAVSGTDPSTVSFSHSSWVDNNVPFGVVESAIGEMQGWVHIMLSLQKSGSNTLLTYWINDTEICTNRVVSGRNGAVASFPFARGDFSDDKDHFWNIGGRPDRLHLNGERVFVTNDWGNSLPQHAGAPMDGVGPVITEGLSYGQSCVTDYHMNLMGSSAIYPAEANGGVPVTCPGPPAPPPTMGCVGCFEHNRDFPMFPAWTCPQVACGSNTYDCAGTDCEHLSCTPGLWFFYSDATPGRSYGFQPEDGEGYRGGVTELWIAPGQFIDWSVAANRYKFHNSDTGVTDPADAQLWGPCDIGKDGKTPTGTKPLIYLTGRATDFSFNRAKNGQQLQLFRNSGGGLVGFLKDYFSCPSQVA